MLLALEEVERTEAGAAAEMEAKSAPERQKAARKRRTNRGDCHAFAAGRGGGASP